MILAEGHEAISLRAIAKAADFSPAGLYAYFDSKEALFYAIVEADGGEQVAILREIGPGLPPEERLLLLCEAYIRHALEHPQLIRLFDSMADRRASLDDPVPNRSPYRVFLDCVEELADQGRLAVEPGFGPEEVTYSIWAVIHGMAVLQMGRLKGFPTDFRRVDRSALKRFLRGVVQ